MDNFVALIRDTLASKNPVGTWREAKNILLTKGLKSITNEDGLKYQYLVPGTVIGIISTNRHIVYLHKNEEGIDEIGVVNTTNNAPVYTTIIKSELFNFQLNCPIEGVFIYNYKEELIIAFSDGVYYNSNSPYVINLDNLPLTLNVDKTISDDTEFTKLKMFPNVQQGNMTFSTLNTGNIDGQSAYITFAYVYDDNTTLPYFSISNLIYLEEAAVNYNRVFAYYKKGVKISLSNLDTNFSKIKIGIVIVNGEVLEGYESAIITYNGTDCEIDIVSLSGYTSTAVENIVLEKTVFEKINTIALFENEAIIGNVTTREHIKFQKYANMLTLLPYRYDEENTVNSYPRRIVKDSISFACDEVYAFYLELQYLDGTYSPAAHIPGRLAESVYEGPLLIGAEFDDLTSTMKNTYSLNWTDDVEEDYKYFHIFNKGVLNSDVNSEIGNKFGFWQNTERYPNTDEYNSTVDYNGNILGGSDMRNTRVRYHRMPSINQLFPFTENFTASSVHDKQNSLLGVKVTNFDTVFPTYIKEQIQGYRLSFVKRVNGNSYVLGNWTGTRKHQSYNSYSGDIKYFLNYYNFNRNNTNSITADLNTDFADIRLISPELFKYSPTIRPTYIQVNNIRKRSSDNRNIVHNKYKFGKIGSGLDYIPNNSATYGTLYLEQGIEATMDLSNGEIVNYIPMVLGQPVNDSNATTYTNAYADAVLDITAYNHNTNVYAGFKSNDLVIVGRTSDLGNNVYFKGGDVFNAVYSTYVHSAYVESSSIKIKPVLVHSKHMQVPNNQISLIGNLDLDPSILTDITIVDSSGVLVNQDKLVNHGKEFTIIFKEGISNKINNLTTITTDTYLPNVINTFPYRVYRGLKIANENLTLNSLRTFLSDSYYDMPNNKGEIIAIRGSKQQIYIQLRFSLFVASIKDKLNTQGEDTYLGSTDLFDRFPSEVLYDEKGYVGSVSKFACQVIKDMYITVNQASGQIFIIKETSAIEITNKGNKNWFWNNWDNGLAYYYISSNGEKRRVDNPYISVGHLVGYDKEYDRLLFIKKLYEFKFPDLIGDTIEDGVVNFDGEFYSMNGTLLEFTDEDNFINKSKTFSFNISSDNWSWVSPHDYFPNIMFYTNSGLYSIINKLTGNNRATIYKHNDKDTKGLFYGQKFASYVDLIFNSHLDISKLLMNITWVTDVINNNGGNENYKTITHIMVYNENQCSGIINLKDNHFELTRNIEGDWNFNNFRDLVINPNSPIIDDDGEVITDNINNIKLWFEKSNFISKFITVRLLIDNVDNDTVYIHEVKVNSLISKK